MAYGASNFPRQKKSDKEKTEAWAKQCIDAAEGLALYDNGALRKSRRNKYINYNLYSDILDEQDVNSIIDPLSLEMNSSPGKMQNYPIANPKIDLLIGEETKRRFDYRVRVINDDAISQKEKDQQKYVMSILTEAIKAESYDEKDFEEKLTSANKYLKHEHQDIRELRGTWVLKHLEQKQNLKHKFNEAFKDVLLAGEEIGQWDIVGGEPVFTKLKPTNVHTAKMGESRYVEDANIILIDGYYSVGSIIDTYYDYLTPTQVKLLDNYFSSEDSDNIEGGLNIGTRPSITLDRRIVEADNAIDTNLFENGLYDYGSAFDEYGNVKVIKVYWKSMRKMLEVTFFDPLTGEEMVELMPEQYKIKKELGEKAKEIWISEWWEGHRIGGSAVDDKGMYLRMQPKKVQYRSMENPSLCHPGIVGTIYQTNDNKAMSLMDRMKPYQYMYNMLMYNTEVAIALNWGKIMKIPLHEMPKGWEIPKWLWFAKNMKAVPYDAFKEGTKGVAQGKLAGNMNQQAPVIDMEMGGTIQMYISMLEYIKQELDEISGVSRQRQGQVSASELVGNVQQTITQSSHITEYWFAEHNYWKKRCLEIGLETAKVAWKDKKNKKLQYVADDMTTTIFTLDGEEFREIDFDISISDSQNDSQLLEQLKQLAHAGIQTDKLNFSQLMDIWTSDSISSIRRKIEQSESEKIQRDETARKEGLAVEQEKIKAQAEEKEKEFAHKAEENEKDRQNKITLEYLKQQANALGKIADIDKDGIPDEIEIKRMELQKDIKEIELKAKAAEAEKDRKHESAENEKERKNKLEIESKKAIKTAK